MKVRSKLLAGLLAVSIVIPGLSPAAVYAASDQNSAGKSTDAMILADFNFDSTNGQGDGFDGGNAVAAIAGGSIELVGHGDGKAARFVSSENDFLDVKAADGGSLLTGYDEITVSYDILPSGSNTNWVFYAAPDDTMLSWGTHGNRERYLGVLVKNGTTEAERYHNTGSRPANPSIAMTPDVWQHADIVYAKDRTVLYLNGKRASMAASNYQLTDILGNDSLFQIGKANWSPGEYSTMTLDNFKIVTGTWLYEQDKIRQAEAEILDTLGNTDRVIRDLTLLTASSDGLAIRWSSDNTAVITADGKVTAPAGEDARVTLTAVIGEGEYAKTNTYTVTVIAASLAAGELAGQLTLPYSSAKGSEVYGNITLPDTVNGNGQVTWTADHPEILNVNEIPGTDGYDPTPAGKITRPAQDTVVTATAHVTLGDSNADKAFSFTVKAAPKPLAEADYTDYFFAYFTGEGHTDGEQIYFSASRDGLNWKTLNDNAPVLTSDLGEKGVRDPFIIRSFEGDKFYLIATDLKIYGGNGWTAAQEAGSQSLMVWESTDLVNWSKQRMVPVSAAIDAGCTWAPEAVYDERTGEYVVFWASKVAGDHYSKQRLYYAKTRDFYSFTEPKIYIDYDQSSIDTTMIKANGSVYRYTKNESDHTNQLGALTKTIFVEKGSDVLGSFTQIPSAVLNSRANQYVEGPTIYKLNQDDAKEDTWCLLLDDFGGGGYYPLLTTDLDSGEFTRLQSGYQLPGGDRTPRHGTPIRITAEEYANVADAYNAERDYITVYAAAYQNASALSDTTLPETVSINGTDMDVTWSWPSSKFAAAYQTVELIGTVDDPSYGVKAKVEVIPDRDHPLFYFVDVSRDNGKESKAFNAVSTLTGNTLKNKTADQLYSDTDRWGRNAAYHLKTENNIDVTDKSQTGLYGENGNVNGLTWQYYLPAGTYTVTAGMREWWTGPRRMYLKISGDHVDAAASDLITVSNSIPTASKSLTFQVKEDGIVTMSVENQQGSDAPALSWFAVAEGEPEISNAAVTEIVVDGRDVAKAAANQNGLTWKGYGLLSGNSTSDLLMDYKQEAPEAYQEMLEVLFGGDRPLITHIKMEMGNDGNNSTGADSCTMRFENEEADASRSPGFALAADAKKINPNIKVSFLRWEMPAWVKAAWDSDQTGKGYEAVYKWYRETIFDAYEKYGYIVDYVDPDKNETRDPDEAFIKWFRKRVSEETAFPSYIGQAAQDAYHKIKIIASDENTTLNIVPSMRNDKELYNAVDAIGFHYSTGTQSSTADYRTMADKDDKEVWYSEGCAAFSYTEYQENKTDSYGGGTIGGYQSPLALADNFIGSFVYSRKTHYIFQPAIGSFYEGAQYDHKEILSAREPWAGYIHYDPVIYMLQHFTKFSKNGWENSDNTAGIWRVISQASDNTSGNRGDLGHLTNENGNPSYLTLAAPDKSAFSIVIVNNSGKTLPYAVKAQNMSISDGAAMEIWETKTDSYMQYKGEANYANGYYELEIAPYSMVTLTTLDCNTKESYQKRLPEEREKTVLDTDRTGAKQDTTDKFLYADDFNYAEYDKNYLASRGNEPRYAVDFTGAWVVQDGKLKQLLDQSVSEWNPNEPNTVIGDFRWMNYKAGVDVTVADSGYAGINIRQQTGMGFEGSGYSLRITKDGVWTLKKRDSTLAGGQADTSADGTYRLELEGRGAFITAWINGKIAAAYTDPAPEYFGRVRLGCSWAGTTFDNLTVEKIEHYEPYATKLVDNASDDISYTGNWNIIAGAGGSSNDWYRSTSATSHSGSSFRFEMEGGGFALIGENDGSAVLDIEADGQKIAENAATQTSGKHCASYLKYGLSEGKYTVTVTVKSGTFVLDAVQFLPYNTVGEDRIIRTEMVYGAAYEDSLPQLPATVTCTTQSGRQVTEAVAWNTDDFRGKAYETVLVSGTTQTSGTPVSAKVEVIPAKNQKLVYFIDASRDEGKESLAFDRIWSLTGNTLKNSIADQKYSSSDNWGRTNDAFREKGTGSVDVADKYQTGWYSNTKTDSLTYQLALTAGDYELTAGFYEWWNNRSMKICVSGDTTERVISNAISIQGVGDRASSSVRFTVKTDGAVTLEIQNATENGEAPVLSWFGIALLPDPAVEAGRKSLQEEIAKYETMDSQVYTADSYKIFDDARKHARNLLAKSDATVSELNDAKAALTEAFGKLITRELADARNSLRAEIANYENTDSQVYTADSYKVFDDALKHAQNILVKNDATASELNDAKAALTEAFGNLITQDLADAQDSLRAEITKYENADSSIYTTDSYQNFASVLQNARDLLAKNDSNTSALNNAKTALINAFRMLVTKAFIDAQTNLKAEIEKYQNVTSSGYTPDSYQIFAEALAAAVRVLNNSSSSEEQLTQAKEALTKTYAGLIIGKALPPIPTTTALDAPTIQSVKSTAGKNGAQVKIVVNTVANADTYTIFRKVGSKVTKLGDTATGIIVDNAPASGKKASYYAIASAKDTSKYTASPAGSAKSITIAKDTSKVTAKQSGKTVKLTFSKVKNAKGYLIYRSTKKNGTYTKLTKSPVKKTTYVDKKAKAKKTYYYKVVVFGKNKTYSAGKVSKKVKIK